jgi:hypothetical protein
MEQKRQGPPQTILNYVSRIVLIYRTRNVYGYNSPVMRIIELLSENRRRSSRLSRLRRAGLLY